MKVGFRFFWKKEASLRRKGTTLVFALAILAVAAMVLAGVVAVMGALVEHTVAADTAMQRRLTLENSRALAVQFVRQQVLAGGSLSGTNWNTNWGGIEVSSFSSAWTNTTRPTNGYNFFSPAGDTRMVLSGSSYYASGYVSYLNNVRLRDGTTNDIRWNIEARSRTPVLSYDVLSFAGSGTSTGMANALSFGRTNGVQLNSGAYLNAAFFTNISDPSFFSRTNGFVPVANVQTNASSHYSSNGLVTIYLNAPNESYYIPNSVTNLTFSYGATNTNMPTSVLRVVAVGGGNPQISYYDTNRPLFLGLRDMGNVQISYAGVVRLTGVFSNTVAGFTTLTNTGTIRGGFLSDRPMTGTNVVIERETDSRTIDEAAIRRGWVETYRND